MKYQYQNNFQFFAQTANDIQDIAQEELESLGAKKIRPSYRGMYFTADMRTIYRINYKALLINRVLAPLQSFTCNSDKAIYNKGRQIPWEDFLQLSDTFAVFAAVSKSNVTHSQYAALKLKDSIVDRFREKTGKRPSIDTKSPDLWIHLFLENNQATISIDTSGGSLHRRGYRKKTVKAPMIETLAASIIAYSEWDAKTPLYDPFCGSGTLLCEAYLKATGQPAALERQRFGFQKMPEYDAREWEVLHDRELHEIRPIQRGLIAGSDLDMRAVKAAQANAAIVDQQKVVTIKKKDVFSIDSLENMTVVTNPPYGIRLHENEDLSDFYKQLGDFLKQRCKNTNAYIYFGERDYIKRIGLRPAWKQPLQNGGLDGRLVKYELY